MVSTLAGIIIPPVIDLDLQIGTEKEGLPHWEALYSRCVSGLNFAGSSFSSELCTAVSSTERASRRALRIFFLDNTDHSISYYAANRIYRCNGVRFDDLLPVISAPFFLLKSFKHLVAPLPALGTGIGDCMHQSQSVRTLRTGSLELPDQLRYLHPYRPLWNENLHPQPTPAAQ